jgi:hypothetical protein
MNGEPGKQTTHYNTDTYKDESPCKGCGGFIRYSAGGECFKCKTGTTKNKKHLRKAETRRKTEDLLEQIELNKLFL